MTRAVTLQLISAGAAKGLVGAIAPAFREAIGADVEGVFGAVGAMRERLGAGAPADVIVLTAAMIDALADEGRVLAGTVAPIGEVATGVAVPAGRPHPRIGDEASLRAAFAAGAPIFFPDPERATAGIHFMRVLASLGLDRERAPAFEPAPNGAQAMAALARATAPTAIGCTQVTEILYTPGVELVGPLPPAFALATVYSAAVLRDAADAALARRFVAYLTGPETADARRRGGFAPMPDRAV